MTVGELLDMLDGIDEDVEVRLAMQPRWAMEYVIGGAALMKTENGATLYLAEGYQLGYLPGEVQLELGWK